MKIINALAEAADRVLMFCVGIMILILLVFSGYSLYDTFYTGRNAFASYDLLKYRPTVETASKSTVNGFDDLLTVNADAAAWLTVYDTHINYPVVQGRDNYEYSNKDIFGKSSLTGAVYLSSDNDRKLDDNFNIIYGHHMDNGAMFGDIDKFHEEAFFRSHTKGFLQTLSQNYRLEFFAFMVTDAYNDEIYGCAYNDKSANIRLLKYIQSNSRYISDSYKNADISSINKLVALSTCEDAATNGRIVLFANAVPGEAEVDAVVENTSPDLLTAIGHASRGESFAFLNLVCLVLTFITIFPILWIRTKFRQIPYAAKTAKALAGENERVSRDMKRFAYSAVAGLVLEITIGAISAAVFIRTENITKPMVISDGNTLVMLLLLVLTYVIDYICFRYRGEKPSAPKEDKDKIS